MGALVRHECGVKGFEFTHQRFEVCVWKRNLEKPVGSSKQFAVRSSQFSSQRRFAMGKYAKRKTKKSTSVEQSPNKSLKKKLAFVLVEAEEIDVDTNPLPQPTNVVQDKDVDSEVIEDDGEDGNNALIASNI
ncbi:hypothetical protein GOP47_0015629 [Adiantum capillus-veneris]|uniref:Uncharacterized protein n=1 Tax=Adiantum capillus-veneris TaxID=13818 RepID=A0A9D4UK00_ADICA|nr:hypothetical protein GOP47_0015629 [Adiantum capillus-veneris]